MSGAREHRDIFPLVRVEHGKYKDKEWELIVKRIVNRWGEYFDEFGLHIASMTLNIQKVNLWRSTVSEKRVKGVPQALRWACIRSVSNLFSSLAGSRYYILRPSSLVLFIV